MFSDVIILAVGANWNSDGESADRATLSLSPDQSEFLFTLAKQKTLTIFDLKPHWRTKFMLLENPSFWSSREAGLLPFRNTTANPLLF